MAAQVFQYAELYFASVALKSFIDGVRIAPAFFNALGHAAVTGRRPFSTRQAARR